MSFLFQKAKYQFNSQLPFVCYCKPNSNKIIGLFQKNDVLISLSDAEIGFAFVSFDNLKRYLIPENLSDIYFETATHLDYILDTNFRNEVEDKSKNDFEFLVKKAVEAIENQQFEKVVLSRKESFEITNFDFEIIFNKLVIHYATAFKYCFYHPKIGFWMGASPEQFLKIEENAIKTVALAGTQLHSNLENIKWTSKEVEEQQIVTNFIVDSLKLESEKVTFSEPYNFKAGNLVHIKTDIQAKLKDKNSISNLINLLHPTPAVCGFPKEKSKQFILENEGYERKFYAGFLGEWNKDFLTFKAGHSDLFVNLRCMEIENNKINLFIGCGITKGSDPEKEFEETVNKSQTMKKVI